MIFAFTSLTPSGATFMDWSWHWLRGDNSVWNKEEGWTPISKNPNDARNAGKHLKNHPIDLDEWKSFLESAKLETKDVSFYPIITNLNGNDDDFVDNINWLISQKVNVVLIKRTQDFPIGILRTDHKTDLEQFLLTYFDKDKDIDLKKLREIVSIRLVNGLKTWLKKTETAFKRLNKEVFTIEDEEWFTNTEEMMVKIFDKYNVPIVAERLTHWRKVAKEWQENYKKTEQFFHEDLPEIADKIVAGEDVDFGHLNLTLYTECLLMNLLMSRHGKRLKLPNNNFPKNAKELHKFLK